jgi:hypothetical protein
LLLGKVDMISTQQQVGQLFEHLANVEPYPEGVQGITERLPGVAFFPGGMGLWKVDGPFPDEKVMILGHNFDSEAKHGEDLKRGDCDPRTRSRTWGALVPFLERVRLAPEDCFFTNFFMGVIKGNESEGRFPGASDPKFVTRCGEFLAFQLKVQRPRVVLTLGRFVPPHLAALAKLLKSKGWGSLKRFADLDKNKCPLVHKVQFEAVDSVICSVVALLHPSHRAGANLQRRRYNKLKGDALKGDAAEVAMVRDALEHNGISCNTG